MPRISRIICLSTFCFVTQAFSFTSGFNLHGIDKAHAMGYTGQGITIGIFDTPMNPNSSYIKGKVLGGYNEQAIGSTTNGHGTMVAAFAVGNKGSGLVGSAYDAKVYAVASVRAGTNTDFMYHYFKNMGVKIVNASWNVNANSVSHWDRNPGSYLATANSQSPSGFAKLAKDNILVIFALGNAGGLEGGFNNHYPRYDETARAMLNAIGIKYDAITQNKDGKLVIGVNGGSGAFIDFRFEEGFGTNLANGGENFSLTVNAYAYAIGTGTSYSAPILSGAAALVQQRFPFLNGAQVADVLLTTANKDYIAPKVIFKKNYLVYIGATSAPTDPEQKKKDLIETGYTAAQAEAWKNKTAITRTREQVFGQGILDIGKAMYGLSTLDANRLNLKDIWTENGRRQAFYTLNVTKEGSNDEYEFSNDISQRLWNNAWHIPNAANSPYKNMQNIYEIGLVKQGEATLILSGDNTYKVDTLIQAGTLKITQRADKTGGSMISNVYVRGDTSKLILDSAKLTGKLYIGDDNSKASANIYANSSLADISIGKNASLNIGNTDLPTTQPLNINILQTQSLIQTKTQTTSSSPSSILVSNNLDNQGSITIGDNGTSTLTINGTYTQGANAVLNLNFNTQGNSILKAQNYNIAQGAKLIYTPLIDQIPKGTLFIQLSLGELEQHFKDFDISVAPTNGILDLNLHSDEKTLSIKVSDTAYHDVLNTSLGKVFNELTNDTAFLSSNPAYEAYILRLASASQQEYTSVMQSLDYKDYLKQNESILHLQSEQTLRGLSLLREKENFMRINPNFNFKYIKANDYTGYAGGSAFESFYKDDEGLAVYNSIAYSYLSNKFAYSNIKSQILATNLGFDYDLNLVNAVFGVSVGASTNKFKRNIELAEGSLQANYHNTFASAQLGLRKSLALSENFTLSPLVYADYTYLYQNKFKEQEGLLFASDYSKLSYNDLSAVAGVNLDYDSSLAGMMIDLDFFTFYERKLLGNDLKNQAAFKDYSNALIDYNYTPDQNIFHLGFNTGIQINKVYLSFNLDSTLAQKSKGVKLSTQLWYNF